MTIQDIKSFPSRHPFLSFGIFLLVLCFIGGIGNAIDAANPVPAPTANSASTSVSLTSLAQLSENPAAYSNQTITTQGTIIGISNDATTNSSEQPQNNDFSAYLVDGGKGIFLNVLGTPAMAAVTTGDVIQITGTFMYYDKQLVLDSNNLENDDITIDAGVGDNGSVSIVGTSSDVVPASVVDGKVTALLSTEKGSIAEAVSTAPSATSFNQCMAEYTKVWNDLCSAAGLPISCIALNYPDSVAAVNTSMKSVSNACYAEFNTQSDPSSYGELLKVLIDASNNGGLSLVSLSQSEMK